MLTKKAITIDKIAVGLRDDPSLLSLKPPIIIVPAEVPTSYRMIAFEIYLLSNW